MPFRVLEAAPEDGADLIALLPRLGAFPRPEHRVGDAIHRPDAPVVDAWIRGGEPDIAIVIARDDGGAGDLLGFAMVRLQPDAFTDEPSAHLESLAVAERAEGQGVGSALVEAGERLARERGAKTMTLHVFQTNERAIALYERKGFVPEWIRYIKRLREE